MSIIKRLYTSMSASVDQLVGAIENHDALIEAAIREQRKKLAAAKVQLKRIQSSDRRAQSDIATLEAKYSQWQQRALAVADQDQDKALACLEQRQRVAVQIERLRQHREQYAQAIAAMAADITRCEDELQSSSQKHELFRARQSSSNALNVVNDMGTVLRDDISNSFERWDATITEQEMHVATVDVADVFEQTFVEEESRAALQEELAELVKAANADRNDQHARGAGHD